MRQSRSERQTRQRIERRNQFMRITAGLALAILLSVGAYWVWSGAGAELLSPKKAVPLEPQQTGEHVSVQPVRPASQPAEAGEGADETAGEEDRRLRLAFVGDIMLGGNVEQVLRRNGFDYPYAQVAEYLQSVDIAAGNLENPITARGEPQEKQWVFRTSPDAVPELAESGFDLFNLANNHTLDYGVEGLQDTMTLLDASGLRYVGAGTNDEEAFRPAVMEKNGVKIAFLGFSRVLPDVSWHAGKKRPGLAGTYDAARPAEAIAAAAEEADLVVVLVHWGIERMALPERYQQELGRRYIDAGADLVIGSHPHVLQGFENYKDRWIAYSLGNFIFTVNQHAPTSRTAILEADCNAAGDCRLAVRPHHTGVAQPHPMDNEDAKALYAHLTDISYNAMVNEEGVIRRKNESNLAWPAYWESKKREEGR